MAVNAKNKPEKFDLFFQRRALSLKKHGEKGVLIWEPTSRKKRDFCVGRGEKRRNTGYVFRAFSTKPGAKRSVLRLSHP
jgi:hypothetical protein